MQSSYKRIGDYIERTNERNLESKYSLLLGININKYFMPSVANIVGTDLSKYKVVKPNQFACNRMHVGRDYRLPIAQSKQDEPFIVSPAYDVFEIIKPKELLSEYLMLWFSRAEFDRNSWFFTDTDVRGKLGWDSLCDMKLPVPSIETQQEIVNEYNTITNRIQLNEQLNQKLEETAQALYKHWFVDFEFPIALCHTERSRSASKDGINNKINYSKGYKSSGGVMVYNEELDGEVPEGWETANLGSFINVINGFAFKSSDFELLGRTPIIKIKNITKPTVSLADCQYFNNNLTERLVKVKIGKGDILISMTGSGANQMNSAVGQVGRYYHNEISLLNQRVGKLEMIKEGISEFVYQFIKHDETHMELLNGSTGSANQANISPEQIRNLQIIMPNENVLDEFQRLAKVIYRAKRVSNQDSLIEIKDLLLSKMAMVGSEEVLNIH